MAEPQRRQDQRASSGHRMRARHARGFAGRRVREPSEGSRATTISAPGEVDTAILRPARFIASPWRRASRAAAPSSWSRRCPGGPGDRAPIARAAPTAPGCTPACRAVSVWPTSVAAAAGLLQAVGVLRQARRRLGGQRRLVEVEEHRLERALLGRRRRLVLRGDAHALRRSPRSARSHSPTCTASCCRKRPLRNRCRSGNHRSKRRPCTGWRCIPDRRGSPICCGNSRGSRRTCRNCSSDPPGNPSSPGIADTCAATQNSFLSWQSLSVSHDG